MSCFFTKLVTWKDPNLSAAFLTAGNLVVLLLLLSGNAISWALFGIVFGVLPLGLVARLTGSEKNVRRSLSPRPSSTDGTTSGPSYYETHIVSQLTPVGLIRLGVYLVLASRLIEVVGIAGSILLVGNALMLLPLGYIKYSPIVAAQIRMIHLDKLLSLVRDILGTVVETIASFGPIAPAVAGGLLAFLLVVISSYLATSTALLVANLSLAGYAIIVVFSVVPLSMIEKAVGAIIPSPAIIERLTERVQLSTATKRVTDLVLWDNYKNSVIAFASMYGFYFVSKFIGVMIPVALGIGLFVAFTLTPTTLKEKAFAEIDKTIGRVRESVVAPIANIVKSPREGKASPPASPKNKRAAAKPDSPTRAREETPAKASPKPEPAAAKPDSPTRAGEVSPAKASPRTEPAAAKPDSPTPATGAGAGEEVHVSSGEHNAEE